MRVGSAADMWIGVSSLARECSESFPSQLVTGRNGNGDRSVTWCIDEVGRGYTEEEG